jgi:hypothetical protein
MIRVLPKQLALPRIDLYMRDDEVISQFAHDVRHHIRADIAIHPLIVALVDDLAKAATTMDDAQLVAVVTKRLGRIMGDGLPVSTARVKLMVIDAISTANNAELRVAA